MSLSVIDLTTHPDIDTKVSMMTSDLMFGDVPFNSLTPLYIESKSEFEYGRVSVITPNNPGHSLMLNHAQNIAGAYDFQAVLGMFMIISPDVPSHTTNLFVNSSCMLFSFDLDTVSNAIEYGTVGQEDLTLDTEVINVTINGVETQTGSIAKTTLTNEIEELSSQVLPRHSIISGTAFKVNRVFANRQASILVTLQ